MLIYSWTLKILLRQFAGLKFPNAVFMTGNVKYRDCLISTLPKKKSKNTQYFRDWVVMSVFIVLFDAMLLRFNNRWNQMVRVTSVSVKYQRTVNNMLSINDLYFHKCAICHICHLCIQILSWGSGHSGHCANVIYFNSS